METFNDQYQKFLEGVDLSNNDLRLFSKIQEDPQPIVLSKLPLKNKEELIFGHFSSSPHYEFDSSFILHPQGNELMELTTNIADSTDIILKSLVSGGIKNFNKMNLLSDSIDSEFGITEDALNSIQEVTDRDGVLKFHSTYLKYWNIINHKYTTNSRTYNHVSDNSRRKTNSVQRIMIFVPKVGELIVYIPEIVQNEEEGDKSPFGKVSRYNAYKFNGSERRVNSIYAMLSNLAIPDIFSLYLLSSVYMDNNEDVYEHFQIKQVGGKVRDIHAPKDDIKELCRNLNNIVSAGLETRFSNDYTGMSNTMFAYRPQKNVQMNARVHAENRYIIKMDISSFFDGCRIWNNNSISRVLKFLLNPNNVKNNGTIGSLNYSNFDYDFKDVFNNVFVNPETKGIYMGNPLSGAMSNYIMYPAVKYIKEMLKETDITFSIYSDDMTFSTNVTKNQFFNEKFLLFIIEEAFNKYELLFNIKPEKTMRQKGHNRKVTGIRINNNNDLTWDRSKYYLLRTMFHNLSKGKTVDDLSMSLGEIKGNLEFFRYTDSSDKIDKLIKKYYDVLVENKIINNENVY